MDIERLVAFVLVSLIFGIGRRIFKLTLKILIIAVIISGVFIFRENILQFINNLISESDKLTSLCIYFV